MGNEQYKQFIVLLDPTDLDEKKLIEFLEKKHTKKHKGSYSSILKNGLKLLMAADKESDDVKGNK